MPNLVAYAALIAWPFVTLAIFTAMKPPKAVVWSLLAGYLLLPVKTSFDFPGVPALDKTSVANMSTFISAMMYTGGRSAKLPREWWLSVMMVVYLVSPMLTVLTNSDALRFGDVILPGLKSYDAFSAAAYKAIDLLPFLLGYNLLRRPDTQHDLLRALATAALGYSVLMLIEIRLSPQLHTWIYGFFPHFFDQQMRGSGFRPVVFLGHGLLVAIFTAMAIIAAGYLARRRELLFGIPAWFWFAYLLGLLVLCKSTGALLLAVPAAALILLLRGKAVQFLCTAVALMVLTYPALRGADIAPVQAIADETAKYSKDRADSFQIRIDNENQLLTRANQRPWFGWGGFGRSRVYDEYSGKDLSITDGAWIIVVGNGGWLGYIATFGLLCLPIVVSMYRSRGAGLTVPTISLILAINLLDSLPNASLGPLTWLMAGSILPPLGRRVKARISSRAHWQPAQANSQSQWNLPSV